MKWGVKAGSPVASPVGFFSDLHGKANLDASIGLADDTIIFSDNIQGIERVWNVLCEVFDPSG